MSTTGAPLNAVIVNNAGPGPGARQYFADSPVVRYRVEDIAGHWTPDFSGDDLIIVPNGADHVAMYGVRDRIRDFLDAGGAVFCFCGFFTPWLPGNDWVHDNTHASKDVRYRRVNDPLGVLKGVDIDKLIFEEHGISGWWACGYIRTAYADSVVLEDTWGRPVMVADQRSTPGLIVATASGPLGDQAPSEPSDGLAGLYRNCVAAVAARKERQHA